MAIKTAEQVANEIAVSGDLQKDMDILREWVETIVDEIWYGYEGKLSEKDQDMMNLVLHKIKEAIWVKK